MTRTMRRRHGGMILIMVLIVVALLTIAGLTFSELMLIERRTADLAAHRAQARANAESGIELARLFIAEDPLIVLEQYGGIYDNLERFQGAVVLNDGEGGNHGRFAIVAPRVEGGIYSGVRFGLEDESTRLNLNMLLKLEELSGVENAARDILLGLPAMTEEVADAILDWIDEDDEPREYGAEVDYYASLIPPYEPKNGPLETIEELLLVRDITPWLLFGSDINRNGFIDADEPTDLGLDNFDGVEGSMDRGWSAYLTLWSLETNLNPVGMPKINLMQDDMEALYDELSAVMSSEWATFIVAFRQNGPYSGTKSGENFTGGDLDLSEDGEHTLNNVLDLIGEDVEVTFDGQQDSTILETPFSDSPMAMVGYLPTLMDYVAVNASPVIPGRINVNEAPRAVLEGIPGMTLDAVDAIMSDRNEDPEMRDPSHRHETWILGTGLVTLDEMKELIRFLNAGGAVYRVQVIGYFDKGGPAVRLETVLDATESPPRMRFYRDLSHLGRGYALETLGLAPPGF